MHENKNTFFCFKRFAIFQRKPTILIPDLYLYSIKTQTDINKKYAEKSQIFWRIFFLNFLIIKLYNVILYNNLLGLSSAQSCGLSPSCLSPSSGQRLGQRGDGPSLDPWETGSWPAPKWSWVASGPKRNWVPTRLNASWAGPDPLKKWVPTNPQTNVGQRLGPKQELGRYSTQLNWAETRPKADTGLRLDPNTMGRDSAQNRSWADTRTT